MTTTTLQAQIDLHSHIITPEYLAALERHNALMDEGFPIPSWDAGRHLDFMNRAGVTTAVLTMPAPRRERCGLRRRGDVHQRLRAAQPRPRGSRRPREADAGRPRILPPLRDARPESFARHETRRRRRAAARHARRITMQSCPASLRGYETELQNGLAMMRDRFAML